MKLYFLTGLPTETDEDTLGIAELARNCVAIGKRHTRPGVGHGEPRRVRAQAAHAVPVVRPEHRGRAAAQGRPRAQRAPARRGGVNLKWHDPAATVAEGIASRGDRRIGARDRARVARRAARSRSGASTSTSTAGSGRWTAEGLSLDWYVHRHRTERRGAARGSTSRPGCTRTSCGATGRTRSPESGVEDCRWTPCYDCGVCTGYGIEHVVASPVPPAGGSQGTGPGPRPRRRGPRHAQSPSLAQSSDQQGRGRRMRGAVRGRPSSARSASPATATSPASGSGRCAGPSCRSPQRRASRPAPRSASAWPCRPAPSRSPSTSTSTSPTT